MRLPDRIADSRRFLLLLALCAQMLLPVAQAQVMAQSGDGLAALACGAGSPDFAASLRDKLPAEVLAAIDAESPASSATPCSACCVAVGDPAPGLAFSNAVHDVVTHVFAGVLPAPQPAQSASPRPPPARAPPKA